MHKATETVLEIDLNALAQNYRYLTSKIEKSTRVMGVVKAFGYGSDSAAIAKELVALGVSYFAVAYPNEGVALRKADIETPCLVLHPLPATFKQIVDHCLEPAIYSRAMLTAFIAFAEKEGLSKYPVHLKFNTGLNRLGFLADDLDFISEKVSNTKSVKIKSMFSHLAASEDASEKVFTESQIAQFEKISEKIIDNIGYKPLRHMLNTSGVLNYPEAQYDMVRTGIGLYGFGNDPEENKHLKPVATLKTVISQIHTVNEGETVGYNRAFKATKTTQTATLPVGHADGIKRIFGNKRGWVTVHGKKAPIIGNVCMDMIMIDVTDIDCEEGDEVIVFGENPSADELSQVIATIPYELITGVSQRVKRVVCRK
ncbi:alanine racemase [Marixanthomonas spongiae]|uniref:Alanine racemase n=1 Tax=Marixanthomonas spongiae TaxID=2174845 RepID=A0A2U0I284_9FLAO|nr:alanine racemase [Marixanthomonas spongiae]PVW15213.1 alanine racemase [Marixanthomonas spongiae]